MPVLAIKRKKKIKTKKSFNDNKNSHKIYSNSTKIFMKLNIFCANKNKIIKEINYCKK